MSKLPKHYQKFIDEYPSVAQAYRTLSDATGEAGPLDAKTRQLVKLGMSIGAGMEGATHSHVRKSLAAGCTREEIRHAVIQATTTLGFPTMMRGLAWVDDVLEKES